MFPLRWLISVFPSGLSVGDGGFEGFEVEKLTIYNIYIDIRDYF